MSGGLLPSKIRMLSFFPHFLHSTFVLENFFDTVFFTLSEIFFFCSSVHFLDLFAQEMEQNFELILFSDLHIGHVVSIPYISCGPPRT